MAFEENDSWKIHRSFFMSLNAEIKLDLGEKAKTPTIAGLPDTLLDTEKASKHMPFVFGRIKDFIPTVKELKVFKGDEEMLDEAKVLNKKINEVRNKQKFFESNPLLKIAMETLFGNTIPLFPYPDSEQCLGLLPEDSDMSIKEGYAVVSFDYNVEKAGTTCLFEMAEMLKARNEYFEERRKSGKFNVNYDNVMARNLIKQGLTGLRGMDKAIPKLKIPDINLYGNKIDLDEIKKNAGKNPIEQGFKIFEGIKNVASNPDFHKDLKTG